MLVSDFELLPGLGLISDTSRQEERLLAHDGLIMGENVVELTCDFLFDNSFFVNHTMMHRVYVHLCAILFRASTGLYCTAPVECF